MTPQDKAKRLVNRFWRTKNSKAYPILWPYAKKAALICVDEILGEWHNYYEAPISEKRFDYWQKVKEEIEKL